MSERNLNCDADLILVREFPTLVREKSDLCGEGDRVDTLFFVLSTLGWQHN